jgi:hypothetical protein
MGIRQEQQNVRREHLGSDPYWREYRRRVGRDLQRPKAYNFIILAPKKKGGFLYVLFVEQISARNSQQRFATCLSIGIMQCNVRG